MYMYTSGECRKLTVAVADSSVCMHQCTWISVDNFTIYTHEAGEGALSVAMEGPSKVDIDFTDNKDGTCDVQYTATEPGITALPLSQLFITSNILLIN